VATTVFLGDKVMKSITNKIKVLMCLCLCVLAITGCKRKSIKDYINKGFSRPQMQEDASFTVQNVGDGGKLYVPSEETVDVSLNIKNQYSLELVGEVVMDDAKRAWFSQEPLIKSLTYDKMVLSFVFKAEAEPSSSNSFFGESVPLTLKIFEKGTGRFLSEKTIIANCNTPPLAISPENITYDADTDEYLVMLPKNKGKHQDLKRVVFTLSSEYGKETVESRIVSIVDKGEQGKILRLKIKGNEGWQLKAPSGLRALKATVYDIAGLSSLKKMGAGNKSITSITLIPESQNVSVVKAEEGVPIPRIKELEEFFDGTDWKNAGYSIAYSMTGFTYDKERGFFKKEASTPPGAHIVTVSLLQNGNTVASAPHTINVLATNVAELDKARLAIQDVSSYESGKPSLTFAAQDLQWKDDRTATVEVPYTGRETKLKLHVVASSTTNKGENEDGSSWGDGVSQKDYEITVPLASEAQVSVAFNIISEDGSARKRYEIVFKRAKAFKIDFNFVDTNVLPGGKASVKASWTYEEVEARFETGQSTERMQLSVARGATVTFDVGVESHVEVQSVASSDASHSIPSGLEKGGRIQLEAKEDFVFTITLMRETTPKVQVRWGNYLEPASTCGYSSGTITYYKDWVLQSPQVPGQPDSGRAVQKDKPVDFEVTLTGNQYEVAHWLVNGVKVEASDVDYTLSLDKTKLTVNSANTDLVVSVVTMDVANPRIDDEKFTIEDVTSDSESLAKVKIEGYKPTVSGNTGSLAVMVPYTGHNTTLRLHIEAAMGCKGEDNGSTADWSDGETKRNANVVLNETPGSTRNFIFKIKSKNSNAVTYTITFTREQKHNVDVQFEVDNGVDPASRITITNIKWEYKKTELGGTIEWERAEVDASLAPPAPHSARQKRIVVSDGAKVEFDIGVEGEIEIESCRQGILPVSTVGTEGGKVTLTGVTSGIVITVRVRPKGGVYMTWDPFSTTNSGYTGGKRSYVKPDGEQIMGEALPAPDPVTHTRKWLVKKGTDVTFAVTLEKNASNVETHEVEKWVVQRAGEATPINVVASMFGQFELNANKTELTIKDSNKDHTVQVVLKRKPFVRVKLVKTSDADTGKIEVSDGVSVSETVGGTEALDKYILLNSESANSVNITVNGLDPSDKVIAVKHTNASGTVQNTSDLFNDKGFFTGTSTFTRTFNAGDTFEVKVARMQKITIYVSELGPYHHTGQNYDKLVIQKSGSDSDPDHIFLPKGGKTIQGATGDNEREIYFTKGTKLDFNMEGLDAEYEITAWKRGGDLFMKDIFHTDPDDDDKRLGRTSVQNVVYNPDSNYTPFNLNAWIKEKEYTYEVILQDFEHQGANDVLSGSDSGAKVKVEMKRSPSMAPYEDFLSPNGEKRVSRKLKASGGLKITAENGSDYYFAMYHTDDLDLGNAKYKPVLEFKEHHLPSKNVKIYVRYTKHLLVHLMPPKEEERASNFPPGFFTHVDNGSYGQMSKYEDMEIKLVFYRQFPNSTQLNYRELQCKDEDQIRTANQSTSTTPPTKSILCKEIEALEGMRAVSIIVKAAGHNLFALSGNATERIKIRYSFDNIDNIQSGSDTEVGFYHITGTLRLRLDPSRVRKAGVLHLQVEKYTP